VGDDINKDLYYQDESMDERTKSDGSRMLAEGGGPGRANGGFSISVLVGVEVELGGARHDYETNFVGQEDKEPEEANTHESKSSDTGSSHFNVL
jgi:hypothetical protein